MRMTEEEYDKFCDEYAENFLAKNPAPEGIAESEWLAMNPPPARDPDPEECWPVDRFGVKIPVKEWTVSDLGCFTDDLKDWLMKELRKAFGCETPGERLLTEMNPSDIREWPREANARLQGIAQAMGITPEPMRPQGEDDE